MKLTKAAIFISLFCSGAVFAEEVEIVGNIHQSVRVPSTALRPQASPTKNITLLKVQLSNNAREALTVRAEQNNTAANESTPDNNAEPTRKQLGMNNVPVLDQGSHGTCATFANTAAVDAAINKGDYVSQLCQLELGKYFENTAYIPIGWNGSLGRIVLSQMDTFGFINMDKQTKQGCDGLKAYPLYGEDPDAVMSLADFYPMSESLEENNVAWSPILDIYQFVFGDVNPTKTLEEVKNSIRAGDRLTFGVILPAYNLGVVGAVGQFHKRNDSWILTPEIEADISKAEAAHAMIITGYDDEAVAVDKEGGEHQGLLTLRNSWGKNIGDSGDFYMSYDYFRALTIEVLRIRSLK